jgi:phosphoheptose isomerase
MARARATPAAGKKLVFVGNGGSAAIASHMATDYSKNGGVRSLALNGASMLTCLGNDLGYDRVFAKQIELHARSGDLVIAISSSGRSANVLNAVLPAVMNHTFLGDGLVKCGLDEMASVDRRDTVPCMHSSESGNCGQPTW